MLAQRRARHVIRFLLIARGENALAHAFRHEGQKLAHIGVARRVRHGAVESEIILEPGDTAIGGRPHPLQRVLQGRDIGVRAALSRECSCLHFENTAQFEQAAE